MYLPTNSAIEDALRELIREQESIEATDELLQDERAMLRLREAELALAAGDVATGDEMAVLMVQRRAAAGS